MPESESIALNHRELMSLSVFSTGALVENAFTSVPPELQDEIIEAIDAGTMTFLEASKLVKKSGVKASPMTINRYYNIYCMQRAIFDVGNLITRGVDEYKQIDPKTAMVALLNLLTTNLFKALIDGSVKFKSKIDPSKLIKTLSDLCVQMDRLAPDSSALDIETKAQKIRQVYGLQ